MIPLRDENPVGRPPIVTWVIIGLCLVAYFAWQPSPLGETAEDRVFVFEHAVIPCEVVEGRPLDANEVIATVNQGLSSACGIDRGRSAPFAPDKDVHLSVVVSMFLHGGLLHIGLNMLFLWVFGNNVEEAFGKIGYALFYLVGGIVATLAHVLLDVGSTVPLVGASGAIAAVMGAYAVLYPGARVRTLVFMLLFFVVDLPAVVLLGFWFVLQFFTDPNAGVAWAAHVGGFVFGVLVALAYRSIRHVPRAAPVPRRY
jgi:membrane associated rhomboid family serine protease